MSRSTFRGDDRISITVEHANGRTDTWGPGEVGESIPTDINWSTSAPGGYKTLTSPLLRRIDRTYADEELFDTIRAYGAGGRPLWEGRLQQLPRQHGQTFGVTPGAVGWAAHLRDDPTFREIYRDIERERWGEAGVERRRAHLAAGRTPVAAGSVRRDATSPAFVQTIGPVPNPTPTPYAEAWYDARGIAIGSLYYAWRKGASVDHTNANFTWDTRLSTDDTGTSLDSSANLRAAGPGSGTLSATAARYYAYVRFFYGLTSGLGTALDIEWTSLAVHGMHGLTLRGTEPNAGFWVSDIVRHSITKGAPLLDTSGIQDCTVLVPHSVFLEPTTVEAVILDVNRYARWDWFVWEDRRFDFEPFDQERTVWRARLDRGINIDLEGETAETTYNGIVVTFTDASGRKRLVGPPGTIGADATSDLLQDLDAENPVNAHGIPRRPMTIDIGTSTTEAAIVVGQLAYLERTAASRRGGIDLVGTVEHPTEGLRPVAEVRAGDYILIEDRAGDVVRKIVSADYTHSTRTMRVNSDNTPARTEALLERLAASLTGRL